jgi:hypothetical protein
MSADADYGRFYMEINIPANTVADVYVPFSGASPFNLTKDGTAVNGETRDGFVILNDVGSGKHEIRLTY